MSAQRPAKRWPAWVDEILAYGPIAELETEWKAAIGDAITEVLDLRQGATAITCACCGATALVPAHLEGGVVRDSTLTDRFDWNSRDGVTFDAGAEGGDVT